MTCSRLLLVPAVSLLMLAGCGKSASPGAGPLSSTPGLTVTLEGKRHQCSVALASESNGSLVPCADVASFVRDQLRLPQGSVYEIRTVAVVEEAEIAKVRDSLNGAGYRLNGG